MRSDQPTILTLRSVLLLFVVFAMSCFYWHVSLLQGVPLHRLCTAIFMACGPSIGLFLALGYALQNGENERLTI